MRLSIAAVLIFSVGQAFAGTTASTGQPFCTSPDNLHEYMLAALNKDSKWVSQIDGCAMLKAGLKMEVIDKGDATAGLHVDRVRVFGPKGSAVGYTINTDE